MNKHSCESCGCSAIGHNIDIRAYEETISDLLTTLKGTASWIACNVFPEELHHIEELRKIHTAIYKAEI